MVSAGGCPAEGMGAEIQPALLARAVRPGEDLCAQGKRHDFLSQTQAAGLAHTAL